MVIDVNGLTFSLPELLKEKEDWLRRISEAEGAEQMILARLISSANLLKPIVDYQVTFERLGWLTLWTKNHRTLDAARVALGGNTDFALEILSRSALEEDLHIRTISEPMLKLHNYKSRSDVKVAPGGNAERKAEKCAAERFRAYAAWCLWSDKLYLEEILHPKTLDGVWDPTPGQELADNLKAEEALYGKLDIETNPRKQRKGRLQQRDRGRHELSRIESWLDHENLKPWTDKLKELAAKTRSQSPSFFGLFDESEATISKRLRGLNLRFSYGIYMGQSMLLHGSSAEQLFHIDDNNRLTPIIAVGADVIAQSALGIAITSTHIQLGLEIFRRILWK